MLKFDMRDGFPAVTTKKLAFNAVKGELLGFFRGYDNAADFRALGCKVWDQNANETPSWVNNINRKGTDDLGRIYGVQWTKWRDTRIARKEHEMYSLAFKGYLLIAHDKERGVAVYEREINQLEDALHTLLTNPYDRRIIISGWRPDELDQIALPPCHVAYQLISMPDNTLHITMWQRSTDTFLGFPFNGASTALMLAIMARLCGRVPGTVTMFSSDTHVYENHLEQVKEQVRREAFAPPILVLSENIKEVTDLADIKGVFERIEPSDISLANYEHHPALAAPMAA
jgi:thymidylate synthase